MTDYDAIGRIEGTPLGSPATPMPLVFVDPAYTSQTCAQCGHLDKRNRVDQGLFISVERGA
ncbi:transposase [Streptomyces canus]|nr:zinc ribbon domain-containing protein [Streptomyces canus]MCX4854006.1 transposase [Streptomyces canus]